jgi:hypothetical protein
MDRISLRRTRPLPGRAAGFAAPAALALGVPAGLAVGALTDVLQAHVDGPFAGLVNAVSPWLVPAFFTGAAARRAAIASLGGILACLSELAGYAAAAESRGSSQSPDTMLFWALGALAGGVVFGYAGFAWTHPTRWRSGLGPALLSTTFLTEAAYFLIALHYAGEAFVFAIAAVAAFFGLNIMHRQYSASLAWLTVVVPCGTLGEAALYFATSRA